MQVSELAAEARTLPPVRKHLSLRALAKTTRNQLAGMPREVFRDKLVHTQALGRHRYYVMDPDLIQEVLVRRSGIMRRTGEMRRSLVPLLGEGLLTAEEGDWRWQRRALAPGFQHNRLQAMLPTMIAAAERTRDRWLASAGSRLRMTHEMMHTTFDIIVETMLSGEAAVDVARFERSIFDYARPLGWVLVLALTGAPSWMPFPGRRRQRDAVRYLRATAAGILAERRRASSQRDDLVALLLSAVDTQDGRTMTDEEIVDNLLTFVIAGHETTSLGLTWTLHLLTRHPEVMAKLVAEIDAVTGGAALRAEHVAQLTYTRAVFSEAMRLYPPAPMISRQVAEEFELGGYRIEAGSNLVVPIFAVHRHKLLWDEPKRFDPERFGAEAAAARSRYAYMPFGAGPRVCIGNSFAMLEGVAVLGVLLGRLRLRDVSAVLPTPVMKVTLRPWPDLEMIAEDRAKGA
ncbi:MAG TPA: cytochrome P450 [Acidisphaera sp.]|nr:cytochrome P450 [Acidisphaera sp.]